MNNTDGKDATITIRMSKSSPFEGLISVEFI